mgnify:CR=1 FL=1
MSDHALTFLRQLGIDLESGDFDLPPFPDTAMKVQRCVSDPNSDIQSLATIVAMEPALAARLMRMANSAMMRRGPMEVTDIKTAISRVGMEMVLNAAVSFAAREAFTCPPGAACSKDLDALRNRCVEVASFSYVLAAGSPYTGKPDEAMLAGLLHAVGKLYILIKAADHPELFSDRRTLETLIGKWHSGVARAIVETWGFPDSIAVGVDEQELKDRDRLLRADLSDILYISNLLARAGVESAAQLGDLDALARLRMNAEQLVALLDSNEEQIRSMIAALKG